MDLEKSKSLFKSALKIIPGGVSSPVRAFKAVGGNPVFIQRAKGSKLWDIDGNKYLDYMGSWGTALLGHSDPEVLEFLKKTLENGLSFGATSENELVLAQEIIEAVPSIDQVRFVNSGTEACMTAVRLARAYSKKDIIIKFDGHYHGHSDSLLAKAGSGLATLGLPSSPGIPENVVENTVSIPFNDLETLQETFKAHEGKIAALILEPIVGNSGFIRPQEGFLQSVEKICRTHDALLIFDEVMTGFRVAWGGAQNLFNIKPDLTTLGKIIGGGLPLAALGGRLDIMQELAPSGPVYQAGTLSGNPLATACGAKTLQILKSKPDAYKELNKKCQNLLTGFKSLAQDYAVPLQTDFEGGLFGFFFTDKKVLDYHEASQIDFNFFQKFFKNSLRMGCYFPPSSYEACFMSLTHSEEDIEKTLDVIDNSLKLETKYH